MFTVNQIKEMIRQNDMHAFYNDRGWRRISHEIMREQHNECQLCRQHGRYSRAKVVHHVCYLRKRPDLAYSRTYTDSEGREHKQLIALCQNCHEQIHNRTLYLNAKKKFTNEEKW